MIPTQMLKGTSEGCILSVIGRKETYGCEISQELAHFTTSFAELSRAVNRLLEGKEHE